MHDASPGHSPMGLGRSLDLRWIGKVAGGVLEVDYQTACCNALCTGVNGRKLSGASVWGIVPSNCRLFSDWTVAASARVDVAMFLSDTCILGFFF